MNTAGRLLRNLQKLEGKSGTNLLTFAGYFGVEITSQRTPLTAAMEIYRDLFADSQQLLKEIHVAGAENKRKLQLYLRDYEVIKRSIDSFVLNGQGNSVNFSIDSNAITALGYMEADLPDFTDSWTVDNVSEFINGISQLGKDLESLNFEEETKQWLRDLLWVMRSSVDRYRTRGARGVGESFAHMLGELLLHKGMLKEVKEKNRGFFDDMTSMFELMQTGATWYGGVQVLIDTGEFVGRIVGG